MWWHDRRERLPLLLAGFAIAVGVQCAVIVSFSAATAVPELQRALDLRTTFGLLAYAILIHLIAGLGNRSGSKTVAAISALLAGGAVLNTAGVSIAGRVLAVDHMTLPWGEVVTLSERTGTYPYTASLFYVLVLTVQLYSGVIGGRLWHTQRDTSILLLLGGVGGTINIITSLFIDLQVIRAPYPTVLSLTFWLGLFAVLLSREFVRRGEEAQQATERFRGIIERGRAVHRAAGHRWHAARGQPQQPSPRRGAARGGDRPEVLGHAVVEAFGGVAAAPAGCRGSRDARRDSPL